MSVMSVHMWEIFYGSFPVIEKYLVPGNVVEDHSLSPAGQYSPAPVIVQTTYNYRYDLCARTNPILHS